MGSAIVNVGQPQRQDYTVRTESQCIVVKRKFTQFTEDLLPPFAVSRYAKLFLKALNYLDEVVRKRYEKQHRVYSGEDSTSFLLHEPSQSSQATSPDVSDSEETGTVYGFKTQPGFVDGMVRVEEIFPNIL